MENPKVLILMGSESDLSTMKEAAAVLDELGVPHAIRIASAHRTPEKAAQLAKNARAEGVKAIIAGAGYAAHLAGAIAANTDLPVIGVPLDSSPLNGLDALLSTAMMPAGVPVATMAIGKAGARNAAVFAAQVIALSDEALARRLSDYRRRMAEKVDEADRGLSAR